MIITVISVLGSVGGFLVDNLVGLAGGFAAGIMALLIAITRKYVLPLLNIERRRRYASYIAVIADDVTDDLIQRYPDRVWLQYLDEAVDRIIEICRVDTEVARRAANASLARK
ncbi:MAG: hypothetical protein JSV44_07910 [Candidatus Zixiibacteriota bacterium]|nr:MAG: hypothetical protein JSV44_07910 [candidate division Zixibacteria bacterium]